MEDRLLREGWLERLGSSGAAVLLLLALAADKHGASFYSRDVMARRLAMSRAAVDQGLARLRELGLVEHRPWRPGHQDGVWQLLSLAPARPVERGGGLHSVRDVLAQLGLASH